MYLTLRAVTTGFLASDADAWPLHERKKRWALTRSGRARTVGVPRNRAVAQLGRAPASGAGGPGFKSLQPDSLQLTASILLQIFPPVPAGHDPNETFANVGS